MSRLARNPIVVPQGMTVVLENNQLVLTHKQKSATYTLPLEIAVVVEDQLMRCVVQVTTKRSAAMLGTTHMNIANLVKGLDVGFVIDLQLVGIGYGVVLDGQQLVFTLGKSHQDRYPIPEDVAIQVVDKTNLKISGIDKGRVGDVADEIVRLRVPDSYKNKGVRYKLRTYINKEVKK